jgi:YcxB-like protein
MSHPPTRQGGTTVNFTVEYQPSQDELARALQQGIRRQFKVLVPAAMAVLAGCGLLMLAIGYMGLGLGMLVAALVFPLVMTWSVRRTGSRRLAYLCVPTTFTMTGDGYETRTADSATTIRWSMFSQVIPTQEFWLFFIGKQFAGFLPRRAFTPGQQAELDTLFATKS